MSLEIAKRKLTAPAHEVAWGQYVLDEAKGGPTIPKPPNKRDDPGKELDKTPTDFECNESPAVDCWRLVHDGKKVIALFESSGITSTRCELFCGTEQECDEQIAALGLDRTEWDEEQLRRNPHPSQRVAAKAP